MINNAYEETQAFNKNFPFKIIFSNSPSRMDAHWQNSIELIYFYETSGCEYLIKGKEYKINKNDLTVANPLEVHSCKDFGKSEVCCLIFPSEILDAYNGTIFCNHIKNDDEIHNIFLKIYNCANSEQFNFLIMSCIYELIAHMLSLYVFDNESDVRRKRHKPIFQNVNLIMDYIMKHFAENITLSDIANKINLSESRISHIFKEITGITVLEYIENIRLNTAKKLLSETDLSITKIALSCGYCDNSYFSLRFRMKNDISPKAYRKINLNNEK